MGFVWCSISGKLYGKQAPPEVTTPHTITQNSELLSLLKKGKGEQHQQAVDFLTHLAVCNTVVPATTAAGQLIYQVTHCLQMVPSGHHSGQFCPASLGIKSTYSLIRLLSSVNHTIKFNDMAVALRNHLGNVQGPVQALYSLCSCSNTVVSSEMSMHSNGKSSTGACSSCSTISFKSCWLQSCGTLMTHSAC